MSGKEFVLPARFDTIAGRTTRDGRGALEAARAARFECEALKCSARGEST